MDKKTFQYIYYLDKFNLKLLYGKKIKNIYPNKIEDHIITLISIIDWLPERLLRLQFVLQNKSLHISNSLCILNSLCFTLNSISKIIGVNKNINFIIDQTTYFRSHWVKIDSPEKKLIKLIKNSILIGRNAFDEYSNFFKKNIVIKNNIKNLKNEIFYEILKNKFIVFTNDRYKILKSTIFLNQRSSKINIVYISMNFYPHFYELANSGLPLSTVMKRKINPFLSTKIKLKSKYKKLLLNKINLAENNRKFLKLNNFKSGLIRYGYHYE